jgi:hypothetical protein
MCLECRYLGEEYHRNVCSVALPEGGSIWSCFRSPVYAAAIGSFLTPPPAPVKQVEAPAQVQEVEFKRAA